MGGIRSVTGGSIEESNPNHEANSPPRQRLLDRHLIQRLLACWDGRPGLIIVEPERNLFIHSFFEPSTEESFCLDLSFLCQDFRFSLMCKN